MENIPKCRKEMDSKVQQEGEEGLKDRPRRPRNFPRKTPQEIEELVIELYNGLVKGEGNKIWEG
jgi:hypothetical protein